MYTNGYRGGFSMREAGTYDVIVVGAGNAAFCAALAARAHEAGVLMLERAPEAESGGNSRFTAGALRFAYRDVEDIKAIIPDISDHDLMSTDFGTYDEGQYFDDMFRMTKNRTDPDLVELLVRRSFTTMKWLGDLGIKFLPMYGRQAFKVDGRFKFWGGLTVECRGGGPGLIEAFTRIALSKGIEIQYESPVQSLIYDGDHVCGVRGKFANGSSEIRARSIVLACGGFEANAEMRTRYLGPGWDLAKVRGTRFNTGDGIRMALDIGASPAGNWSGCHAVGWDRNAPEFGDLAVGDGFQKHSYPFGIMVNSLGLRFVDEGEDFRNYTYAKYGRVILEQPEQFAWQIFDKKVLHLLRDEYRMRGMTKIVGRSIEELAAKMDGVDRKTLLNTIATYNEAVRSDVLFSPNIKDGKSTVGLVIPKSNWAMTIDAAPFEAYQVTCGITFTFGGLRVDTCAQVINNDFRPIHGLFAAGELMGGLFYFNYPGGAGLMAGAVFGRIAGESAATASMLQRPFS
jgi:tricarballylate dehydrogenase